MCSVFWFIFFSLTILSKLVTPASIVDFLGEIKEANSFTTVLCLKKHDFEVPNAFFEQQIISNFNTPLLQFDETTKYFLKHRFNDNFLAFCLLTGVFENDLKLLNALARNSREMRYLKIIFLLGDEEENETFLKKLFEFCWKSKMLNVVVIYASFQETSIYYRYTPFPHFELEKVAFDVSQPHPIYPDRMRDFKGFSMPVVVAGHSPRIIIKSTKIRGQFKYGGIVGNFMNIMSEHMNLNLVYVKTETIPISVRDGIDYVEKGEAEMSTGIQFSEIPRYSSAGTSYPLEIDDWCIMTPLPADVPRFKFFIIIITLHALLVTLAAVVLISMLLSWALYMRGRKVHSIQIFLHDAGMRGLLAQPFVEVRRPTRLIRGIYIKICLLGLMLTTYYNAFFCTFLTKSPKEPLLLTIEDLQRADVKVRGLIADVLSLLFIRFDFFEKLDTVLFKSTNDTEFVSAIESFDTKYAYIVPLVKWNVVQEQQKWFTRPLFHRPESLCELRTVPMTVPIHKNSYFTLKLNQFMLHIMQMGFLEHWQKSLYYELVENKDIIFGDRSENQVFKPLEAEDFQYIFMGMVFMLCLSSLFFVVELLTFNLKLRLKKIKCPKWYEKLIRQLRIRQQKSVV